MSLPTYAVPIDSTCLREWAERCARLARKCPEGTISHELEALGIDLMEKAAEVDSLLADLPTPS